MLRGIEKGAWAAVRAAYFQAEPKQALAVLDSFPRLARSWRARAWRGAVLRRCGEAREAVYELTASQRIEPRALWPRVILGESLRDLGAPRRGFDCVQSALQEDPAAAFAREFTGNRREGARRREDCWLHAVRGAALRSQGELSSAADSYDEALRLDPECGWAWGGLGEIRVRMGLWMDAWRFLFEAEMHFPDWPSLALWQAEALAGLERPREAERSVTRAIQAGEGKSAAFLLRANLRGARGDAQGQMRDFVRAMRTEPKLFLNQMKRDKDARAAFLSNWSASRRAARFHRRALRRKAGGDTAEALRQLGKAIEADPEDAALYRSLARLHKAQGDPEAAGKALDQAVSRDPAWESLVERAEHLHSFGLPMQGVEDYTRALALRPRADFLLRRGRMLFAHRQFALCLKDYEAALALSPDSFDALSSRSEAYLELGRAADALKDIDAALRLAPQSGEMIQRRCLAFALLGDRASAGRALAALRRCGASRAQVSWVSGYLKCLDRDYHGAAGDFRKASRAARCDPAWSERAESHGAVADICRRLPERAGRAEGKIVLCGIGVFPPGSISLAGLRALQECDVLYKNVSGAGVTELLRILCRETRAISFRYEQDVPRTVETLLQEARARRSAAFVTFGHPLIFGPLARELLRRTEEEGIPCEVVSGLSSFDAMLAGAAEALGHDRPGYQVLLAREDVVGTLATTDVRWPLLVQFPDSNMAPWKALFFDRLTGRYPGGHEALLFDTQHEHWGMPPRRIALEVIAKLSPAFLRQCLLVVPPADGNGAAARGQEKR